MQFRITLEGKTSLSTNQLSVVAENSIAVIVKTTGGQLNVNTLKWPPSTTMIPIAFKKHMHTIFNFNISKKEGVFLLATLFYKFMTLTYFSEKTCYSPFKSMSNK